MRILDRHINRSIIKTFILTVFMFTVLYIVIDVTAQLDEFIDRKVPLSILIKYYLLYIPVILLQTSSFACLISVLLTFSSLNNSNEITVMRASGLDFWRITKPAIFFSLLVSVFVFWLGESYVPRAMQETRQIREENMVLTIDRHNKKMEKIKNLTFYGLKNRLYFVDTFDPDSSTLEGITIIELDDKQNIKEKTVAYKGVWTGIAWKFYNCQITSYLLDAGNRPDKVKVYREKLMDIKETPADFLRQRLDVAAMNIKQLNQYINRFSNSGAIRAINNLKVDLHQKITYPIGNFVIVLIGLPFAMMIKNRKGMTFTSLGIAIVIGFLYYVTNALAIAFGKGDLFPPFLSAWITPLIFTVTALIVIESNF
jgi:lipopolysaccharide export system permease protein